MKMKRLVALLVIMVLCVGLVIFSTPGSAYGQTNRRSAHPSSARKHKRASHRRPAAKKKSKARKANTSY